MRREARAAVIAAAAAATLLGAARTARYTARADVEPAVRTAAAPEIALQSTSTYDLGLTAVGADGARHPLAELRGHPVLAAMFFASCPSVCPLLIGQLKQIEAAAPVAIRRDLRVVLVSFDPARDTPAALADVVRRHGLDPRQWRVMVARDEGDARLWAAVLGVRYRASAGGLFDHTTRVTVLDRDGRVRAQSEDDSSVAAALASLAR